MRRRFLVNATLATCSLVVALLLVELGLRLFNPQPLAAVGRSPRLGWIHKPNTSFVYERAEFRVPVQYSSIGLRDREYTREKPAGTFRIALLGDSFVEALQVPVDSMLSRHLERRLAAYDETLRWEVMNFGVAGYGSCQQLLLLEERVLDYSPDLVIAVHYHNDFDDNEAFAECQLDASGNLQLRPDASLSRMARWTSALKSNLWQHSHLFVFVSTRRWSGGRGDGTDAGRNARGALPLDRRRDGSESLESQLTRRSETPEARRALELHARILERLRVRCKERDLDFIAVLGVSAGQLDPSRQPPSYALEAPGERDVTRINRVVRETLESNGFAVVDLLPAFQEASAREALFFDVDGHWSAAGHRTAAEAIATALQRGVWLQPRSR